MTFCLGSDRLLPTHFLGAKTFYDRSPFSALTTSCLLAGCLRACDGQLQPGQLHEISAATRRRVPMKDKALARAAVTGVPSK